TSPYEFYQFWYNTDDRDVIKFLHYFTFISYEEIEELTKQTETNPGARLAQKRLAEEVTTFVHGTEALNRAIKISEALFSGEIKQLSVAEIKEGFKDVPTYETEEKALNLVDLLVAAHIYTSKRREIEYTIYRAMIMNSAANLYIDCFMVESDWLDGTFTVIQERRIACPLLRVNCNGYYAYAREHGDVVGCFLCRHRVHLLV